MSRVRRHAHALLELLDPDLATSLAVLVDEASRALGPYPALSADADGEPDGYAGIGREPHYERLLASEWLLADELPEEFLRRAAQREHMFHTLSREKPRARQRCLALIDTGPDTLGLPRIAMLAFLLALELRAQAAELEFVWSTLAAPETLHTGITGKEQARAFLEARSAWDVTPEELALLESVAKDDVWLLGSPRCTAQAMTGPNTVTLEEPWGTRAVLCAIASGRRRARTLSLEMPANPECIRLLRHPFREEARPTLVAPEVQGAILFAGRGYRLLTLHRRLSDASRVVSDPNSASRVDVLAHSIPSHQDRPPGRTRSFEVPRGERLLAATYSDRLIVVTAVDDALHFYGLPPPYADDRAAGRSLLKIPFSRSATLRTEELASCIVLLGKEKEFICMIPLADGTTLLTGRRTQLHAHIMQERIFGHVQGSRAEQAVWLVQKGSHLELVAQTVGDADWRVLSRVEPPAPDEVMFCCPRENSAVYQGFVGFRHADRVSVSMIPAPGRPLQPSYLFVPSKARALGLCMVEKEPQLVALEADGQTFSCFGRRSAQQILRVPSQVEAARLSPHSPLLFYATRDQWTLLDITKKHVLWTRAREEETP